jgi:hypothetical protein
VYPQRVCSVARQTAIGFQFDGIPHFDCRKMIGGIYHLHDIAVLPSAIRSALPLYGKGIVGRKIAASAPKYLRIGFEHESGDACNAHDNYGIPFHLWNLLAYFLGTRRTNETPIESR